MSYAEQIYEETMGHPPVKLAVERTPSERRASLEEFFAIIDSMSDEDLAANPLADRPLNISIL